MAALTALTALVACSGPVASQPDPAALLRQSASAMSRVHSLAADARFGPGVTYQGFTLSSAQTQIALPSSSDTTLKVKQQDFLVDVRVVSVDGQVYLKVPFGKFTPVTPEQAAELPDLAAMFDARSGLPALLAAGRNPRYEGADKVGATDCDRVSATYTPDQVAALIKGLRPAGDIAATMWIGKADHRLYRVLLKGPLIATGSSTSIDITMRDYDAPVTIVRPTP